MLVNLNAKDCFLCNISYLNFRNLAFDIIELTWLVSSNNFSNSWLFLDKLISLRGLCLIPKFSNWDSWELNSWTMICFKSVVGTSNLEKSSNLVARSWNFYLKSFDPNKCESIMFFIFSLYDASTTLCNPFIFLISFFSSVFGDFSLWSSSYFKSWVGKKRLKII